MYRRLISLWDSTSFYFDKKVYYSGYFIAVLFVLSIFFPLLQIAGIFLSAAILILVLADSFFLYQKKGIEAQRSCSDRFSIGDENRVILTFRNNYNYKVTGTVLDELPYKFGDLLQEQVIVLEGMSTVTEIEYSLKPMDRGEYHFGRINFFAKGPLTFVRRRFILGRAQIVKIYPSYMQLRRYKLLATANKLSETGSNRIRKLGQSIEFEQIKEYVRGDDYRTINWKATARKSDLMTNNFTDERSQQIYCLINKGRVMKMPFAGMTLLDYAINATLVVSGVALQKQDKAGVIAFEKQVDLFMPAERKPAQINKILESLYKQETQFLEADLERLFSLVRNRITQRSLLILFTNFESFDSLERVLPSLKLLAHYHLLLVVFFDNTELKNLVSAKASTTEDIYIKTIAEKYRYEKQLIVKELQKSGIITVLSTPESLTMDTLNKYLELKARKSI